VHCKHWKKWICLVCWISRPSSAGTGCGLRLFLDTCSTVRCTMVMKTFQGCHGPPKKKIQKQYANMLHRETKKKDSLLDNLDCSFYSTTHSYFCTKACNTLFFVFGVKNVQSRGENSLRRCTFLHSSL
jgi:hypothetical protein